MKARQTYRGIRRCTSIAILLLIALCFVACEGIECSLNNVVTCNIGFYSSSTGEQVAVADTLTITANGTDSIIYNRGTNTSNVSLPMSFWADNDTLALHVYSDSVNMTDYLYLSKSNQVHTESPDCPATMFHTLTNVTCNSTYGMIDSVVIANPNVNFNKNENVKVYFHTSD